MAWAIDYADTARNQLRKLDKQTARRIVDFMEERISALANPRDSGKALTGLMSGLMSGLWRYRIGDCQVVCDVQDGALRVLVVQVGNRQNIYQ